MSKTLSLKSLGSNKTKYSYDKPDANLLERFENDHHHSHYTVTIEAPEFTSL